jgi:NADH-quinone oxidoreductase subunit C
MSNDGGAVPAVPGSGEAGWGEATAPSGGFRKGAFGVSGSGDTSGFGGLVRVEPGGAVALHSTERPYGGYFDEVTDALIEAVGQATYDAAVQRVLVDRGEITYFVNREYLLTLVQALRDDDALRFELLSSVSGVDYFDSGGPVTTPDRPRLHTAYHLTSMTYRRRIRLEVAVTAEDPHVPSVTPIYPTADWQERETWDMFGIVFDGHPGLTRILMPDDWDGHPQRKDYPLGGVPVEYHDATIPPPDTRRAYR